MDIVTLSEILTTAAQIPGFPALSQTITPSEDAPFVFVVILADFRGGECPVTAVPDRPPVDGALEFKWAELKRRAAAEGLDPWELLAGQPEELQMYGYLHIRHSLRTTQAERDALRGRLSPFRLQQMEHEEVKALLRLAAISRALPFKPERRARESPFVLFGRAINEEFRNLIVGMAKDWALATLAFKEAFQSVQRGFRARFEQCLVEKLLPRRGRTAVWRFPPAAGDSGLIRALRNVMIDLLKPRDEIIFAEFQERIDIVVRLFEEYAFGRTIAFLNQQTIDITRETRVGAHPGIPDREEWAAGLFYEFLEGAEKE